MNSKKMGEGMSKTPKIENLNLEKLKNFSQISSLNKNQKNVIDENYIDPKQV